MQILINLVWRRLWDSVFLTSSQWCDAGGPGTTCCIARGQEIRMQSAGRRTLRERQHSQLTGWGLEVTATCQQDKQYNTLKWIKIWSQPSLDWVDVTLLPDRCASFTPCQRNKVCFLILFKLCLALWLVLVNIMLARYLFLHLESSSCQGTTYCLDCGHQNPTSPGSDGISGLRPHPENSCIWNFTWISSQMMDMHAQVGEVLL